LLARSRRRRRREDGGDRLRLPLAERLERRDDFPSLSRLRRRRSPLGLSERLRLRLLSLRDPRLPPRGDRLRDRDECRLRSRRFSLLATSSSSSSMSPCLSFPLGPPISSFPRPSSSCTSPPLWPVPFEERASEAPSPSVLTAGGCDSSSPGSAAAPGPEASSSEPGMTKTVFPPSCEYVAT